MGQTGVQYTMPAVKLLIVLSSYVRQQARAGQFITATTALSKTV